MSYKVLYLQKMTISGFTFSVLDDCKDAKVEQFGLTLSNGVSQSTHYLPSTLYLPSIGKYAYSIATQSDAVQIALGTTFSIGSTSDSVVNMN